MNHVASSNRIHIAFFGMRNAGKSSVVNQITSQDLSVVSDVKGTTTDPVRKSMELLPLGPVVIIDTPGMDDEGELGQLRVKKTIAVLDETDIAVLVLDATKKMGNPEQDLLQELKKRNLPYIIAYNKIDLMEEIPLPKDREIYISAKTGYHINALKEKLGAFAKTMESDKKMIADLLEEKDFVVCVIPIDEAAPKNRLIMPQQMAIRDILDAHASVISCQVEELDGIMKVFHDHIKMVITDSQAFGAVASIVPDDIMLTSFSILMARFKGELEILKNGADMLSDLHDGDYVLIAESCTHHRQCNDIGTVKLPAWITGFSKAKLNFEFVSGGEFPDDLSKYRLIVHCGGCMINESLMKNRLRLAKEQNVPIVNYGMAIAKIHGILARSLEPFL